MVAWRCRETFRIYRIVIFAAYFIRRAARAVEWDGFENRCTGNGTGGSNPSLSAENKNPGIFWIQGFFN